MLSASIAHEVRNPLSAIKSITTVLKERLGHDAGATEDLSVVLSEIDRLSQVVNRLLRFARPDTDNPPVNIPLSSAVADVIAILNHEASRANVTLHSEGSEGVVVHCRPGDLKEALFNLILNGIQAIDAATGGRVEVSATAEAAPEPDGGPGPAQDDRWVRVTVSDTGSGIPESASGRVFEPFYTTKVSGSGLGLAIVRQDVARMGGTIALEEPEPGRPGATFVLRLPGAEDEDHHTDRG
jgi:signal transduction histidine kinase